MLSVAITFGIIVALIGPVIDFFREVPFGDFFSFDEGPRFAVCPLISATLVTTVIALLVAVPLGLGAAQLPLRVRLPAGAEVLKPTVELLAGVPSVVYGFFAVMFVTPTARSPIPPSPIHCAASARSPAEAEASTLRGEHAVSKQPPVSSASACSPSAASPNTPEVTRATPPVPTRIDPAMRGAWLGGSPGMAGPSAPAWARAPRD